MSVAVLLRVAAALCVRLTSESARVRGQIVTDLQLPARRLGGS